MPEAPVPRCRAVLLDALGTLVQLEPPWPLLSRLLAVRHEIEIPEARAKDAMLAEFAYYRAHHREGFDERSLEDLWRRCAEVLGDRLPELGDLSTDALKELLLDSLRFTPFQDAAPVLGTLRAAGLRMAVVSNWDCSLAGVLAGVGLGGAVDAVVTSAEVGVEKPQSAIFQAALERIGRRPEEALFVGDSLETDVLGARAAGIRAALLDRPAASDGLEVERIFSLSEVPRLAGVATLDP
jgi:HAD superfamily hydrolase (TIGR01549 family)